MTTIDELPIACDLPRGASKERSAWITALARKALRAHRRDDLKLELRYAIAARDDVLKMVRNERTCCAFLRFDVREQADDILVTITAPEAARDAANALFAQFVPDQAAALRCACSASAEAERQGGETAVSVTAATLASSAVACVACCIVPFALPAAMLAGVGSTLALFDHAHRWMTNVAALAVIASWAWLTWQAVQNNRKPSTSAVAIMFVASGIITIALLWPLIDRPIIQALRSS